MAEETLETPVLFKAEDSPSATFTTPGAVLSAFKEDYRRTTRDGQNVYAMIDAPELYISADEYKALANKKDAVVEKPKLLKQARTLSKAEADELYEPLIVALPQGGEYIDKLLWKLYPHLDERPIWSNLTEIEAKAIAKLLLKRAQVDPTTAQVVRAVIDGADYATALVAIGTRTFETAKAHRDRPRVERKKKFSLVRMPEVSSAN